MRMPKFGKYDKKAQGRRTCKRQKGFNCTSLCFIRVILPFAMVISIAQVWLFVRCSIPTGLFYFFTNPDKGVSKRLLIVLLILEMLMPLTSDEHVVLLDKALVAIKAVVMSACMGFYIRDRRQKSADGKQIAPFYDVLGRWNENPLKSVPSKVDSKEQSINIDTIRRDSRFWLLRAVVYMLLFVPAMTLFDGFLRVCMEPPEIRTNVGYIDKFVQHTVSLRSLYYHAVVGFTLHLHVAIVPVLQLLFTAVHLFFLAQFVPNNTPLARYHQQLARFVAQPPIFDKPWLSRNVHELWSRRWHQIFRPGFKQIAYQPVRALFGKNQVLGAFAGTVSVFLLSGLMHDYIVLVMLGYKNWNQPGILGYQTIFFLLQAVATVVTSPKFSWIPIFPASAARLLTAAWMVFTAPLFVEPFLRLGLHLDAEVPGFPRTLDPYLDVICPYGGRS